MIKKEKVDYKLVNIALIALTIFLIYRTGNLWIDGVNKFIAIITPFVLAFALAYATQPLVEKMQSKGIPKGIAIAILLFVLLSLIIFTGYIITSMLVSQLSDLFGGINTFLEELSTKDWNVNISGLQHSISDGLQSIMKDVTTYVSNGAINLISSSIDFIGKLFFGIAAYIYFLIDMDKIRAEVKKFFKTKKKKTNRYGAVEKMAAPRFFILILLPP